MLLTVVAPNETPAIQPGLATTPPPVFFAESTGLEMCPNKKQSRVRDYLVFSCCNAGKETQHPGV